MIHFNVPPVTGNEVKYIDIYPGSNRKPQNLWRRLFYQEMHRTAGADAWKRKGASHYVLHIRA